MDRTDVTETPENEFDELELGAEPGEDDLAPLDAVIAERDDWKDKALRMAAEVENVKRRAEHDANNARAYGIQRFAQSLLGVADNLQRALQAAPQGSTDAGVTGLVTGLEMTEKSLLQAFEANGLTRVTPTAGERFDPNVHQAVSEQPSAEVPPGTVIQTFQPGYVLFGRTVRPAMVIVAAKGAAPSAAPGSTVDTQA
jgi:molecular chaperone GrpE